MRPSFLPLTAGLALLSGCLADGPGERGELGNDRFFYACAKPADAACDELMPSDNGQLLDIPTIALGSVFALTTEDLDTEPASPTDRLVPQDLTTGQKAFRADKAGVAVLVAYEEAGNATDLTHVEVVEPARADLFQLDPATNQWIRVTGPITVATNQLTQLRVAPVDAAGDILAGALQLTWATEPTGVLTNDPSGDDNVIGITGATPGDVTVTATLGTLEASVAVTFTGATP